MRILTLEATNDQKQWRLKLTLAKYRFFEAELKLLIMLSRCILNMHSESQSAFTKRLVRKRGRSKTWSVSEETSTCPVSTPFPFTKPNW